MRSFLLLIFITLMTSHTQAATSSIRIPLLDNAKVNAWKTVIYPGKNQGLKMHRHDCDRVVVALTDGKLKVTNDKGAIHYLEFKKARAYYLPKDTPDELHTDENLSHHPIKVIVVELK